jgi:hypothetical protein
MAINGSDYTKELAGHRAQYQDSLGKAQRAHDSDVEKVKSNAVHTANKERKVFSEARTDYQNKYEDKAVLISKQADTGLREQRVDYNDKLEAERETFVTEKEGIKKGFRDRLASIKENYNQTTDAENGRHLNREDSNSKSYKERLDKISSKYNSNINDISERTMGAGNELAQDFQKSKETLVRGQNKDMQSLVQSEIKKSNLLKDKINEDVEKLRNAQGFELKASRENASKNFKALKISQDHEVNNAYSRFSEMNDDLVKKATDNNYKSNKQMRERISDIYQGHTKELREVNDKMQRMNNGGDAYDQLREKQDQSNLKTYYDKKIITHKDQVNNVEDAFRKNNKDINARFNKDLMSNTHKYSQKLEDMKKQHSIETIGSKIKQQKHLTKIQDTYTEKAAIDKENHHVEMESSNRNFKSRVGKLNSNFNETISDINYKNNVALEHLRKDHNKDKKIFMKENLSKTVQEKYDLRKGFETKMNNVVNTYEREIDKLSVSNNSLKKTMSAKINNEREKANTMVKDEKEIMSKKLKKNQEDSHDLLQVREGKLRGDIDSLHTNYRKKLDAQSYKNDIKMETMSREYEDKLANQKKTLELSLGVKERSLLKEQKRLKSSYAGEMNRVVGQYEEQLDNAKKTHTDQVNRISQYRKAEMNKA